MHVQRMGRQGGQKVQIGRRDRQSPSAGRQRVPLGAPPASKAAPCLPRRARRGSGASQPGNNPVGSRQGLGDGKRLRGPATTGCSRSAAAWHSGGAGGAWAWGPPRSNLHLLGHLQHHVPACSLAVQVWYVASGHSNNM
jgi:hypothetical protein